MTVLVAITPKGRRIKFHPGLVTGEACAQVEEA